MKFKVLKPFFYLVDKKNYSLDQTIELTKEASLNMLNNGYLSEVKEVKTKKND